MCYTEFEGETASPSKWMKSHFYSTFTSPFPQGSRNLDHMQTSFHRTTAQGERKILEGELREFRFEKRESMIMIGLKMNLLNYGSPCVHKMCILLCFIISFFRNHLLQWIRDEKVKKSRMLRRFYLKNLSCFTIGLEIAINLCIKRLYCRQLTSLF